MFKFSRRTAVLAMAMVSACSFAQVTLTDGGSVAQIHADTTNTQGLYNWTLGNGPNEVLQQVYVYRVNGGAAATVNSISAPNIVQPTNYLANIGYTSGASFFDLNFRYLLTGAAPNSADLAEVTTLINRGQGNLNFTLYEYDLFAPGGTTGGTGTLLNSSTIRQVNNGTSITVGATGIPDHWMIDTSGNVVNAMLAGNLADANSPFTNANDLAFAFQWNVNLAPGQQWQMSKDKMLGVPEPATLLTLGGLAFIAIRRRKRA